MMTEEGRLVEMLTRALACGMSGVMASGRQEDVDRPTKTPAQQAKTARKKMRSAAMPSRCRKECEE